jgi:glutathione S-transferase
MSNPSIKLHHFAQSGHSHRVKQFLTLLGLPFETVLVNLPSGEHKRPAFLALNVFGQVPVLEDGDVILADSNAILVYLAKRYDATGQWLPEDAVGAAQVQRWFSVAAGPLASGAAAARAGHLFGRPVEPRMYAAATALFKTMDAHLANQAYLASQDKPTLADIAMHAYTAHAPEGAVSLEPYAHVRAWLQRIEALPGFVAMPAGAVPAPVA